MWEPRYEREGYPVTADDPSPLSPFGQFQGEMKFMAGLSSDSPYERRALRSMMIGLGIIVAIFFLGYLASIVF